MKRNLALIAFEILLGVAMFSCHASDRPCSGGCASGEICDYEAGKCVEIRPPDKPSDVGRYNSSVVDSSGRLMIAAYSAGLGDLVFGKEKDDGQIAWEYVDGLPSRDDPGVLAGPTLLPGPDVGLYASLALDDLQRPHIAYFDRTNGALKYAVRSGQGWSIQTLPSLGDETHVTGRSASLALGSDGLSRIAFLDETLGAVMLARELKDGNWLLEQISSCEPSSWSGALDGEQGRMISLVLDAKDNGWVAYHDVCTGRLMLASRGPSAWSSVVVDPGPGAGTWVCAGLDVDGNPAMAYYLQSDGSLNYSFNKDGALKNVKLDSGRKVEDNGAEHRWPVGQACSMVFGFDGLPRIFYLDSLTMDLKAVVGNREGGFEDPEVLDSEGLVGLFNSSALGTENIRLVSYHMTRDEDSNIVGTVSIYKIPAGTSIPGRTR